jgi:hypothetical protein
MLPAYQTNYSWSIDATGEKGEGKRPVKQPSQTDRQQPTDSGR